MSWRLILDPPRSGTWNMAADRWLLESATRPTLRLYQWDGPWVSLGYAQKSDWLDGDIPAVRRPTGGRAVLHDNEITYCIVLPQAPYPSVQANYEHLTELWRTAFQQLGFPVEKAAGACSGNANPSCYQRTQRGELCLHGKKFLGSAQLRRGSRLLQHGSIPRGVDSGRFARLFPRSELPAVVACEPEDLVRAFPVPLLPEPWSAAELDAIEEALCPALF